MSARTPLSRALPTDRLPHGWQVAATLLLTGALFALGWALSQAGLLDIAATGLAFFGVALARQMRVGFTTRAPREFSGSARMLDQIRSDFQTWLSGRTLLSHALIAAAHTTAFLLLRSAISAVLSVIASPWVALAVGLAAAAAVASPFLVSAVIDTLAGRSGLTETGEEVSPE